MRRFGRPKPTGRDLKLRAALFVAEAHPDMLPTYTPERIAQITGAPVDYCRELLAPRPML